MVEVNCSTGGMSVIASGIGITYSRDADYDIHLNFNEEENGKFNFTVRLKFEDDSEIKVSELKPEIDTGKSLITLRCINFNDPIGTGRQQPMKVATYGGRSVYFNFWIMATKTVYEVRYCFYLEDK